MEAVVQVPAFDAESLRPWPVASMAAWSWLTLNAGCADEEVGLFVAALADRLDVESPAGCDQVVAALLAEERLIVEGGLQLVDTVTGMVVVPGCCAGLEDWRGWADVLTGGWPWLGHDPDPEVEVAGDDLRVWQDAGRAGVNVVVPRLVLPILLRSVQQDLAGFLAALEAWAKHIGLGETGTALAEAVDRDFTITAPLNLPTD